MKSRKIGILSSGGDSPGMNAAIRAAVRTALYYGHEVYGIKRGYQGMIEGDIFRMKSTDVSDIIQRGGTVLKTARSKEFMTVEGREKAYRQMMQHGIDGLILIGGDGTFRGANAFFQTYNIPAIGIPGTIDKDLSGTDQTIGFDTAVNTAVWAIDKIRDTAEAHDRLFLIEVMGRDAGYIAIHSGIACGAEDILIPEQHTDIEIMLNKIANDELKHKSVHIIVVAEHDELGGVDKLMPIVQARFPNKDVRGTILGHIQRGGSPSSADRVLASRLGHAAVLALLNGQSQQMAGVVNGQVVFTPFSMVVKQHNCIDQDMLDMIKVLN